MNIPNWILLIVQIATTGIVGAIGFFIKRELTKIEKVNSDLQRFKIKVSEEYVRKDDYNYSNGEILRRLEKIQDVLFKMNGIK